MDGMAKETLYGATSATQKIYQNFLVNIEDMDVAETEVDDDFLGDDFEEEDLCVSRTDNKSFSIEYLDRFHTRSRYPINIFLHP